VVVGGLATDYCVRTTVLQLCRAGFRVVVNRKACRGVAEDTSSAAFMEMKAAGATLVNDSSELETR
jgi:nicotinamidase/pyrazinamidase